MEIDATPDTPSQPTEKKSKKMKDKNENETKSDQKEPGSEFPSQSATRTSKKRMQVKSVHKIFLQWYQLIGVATGF